MVNNIYRDSEENPWVGTIGQGLFMLPFLSQGNRVKKPNFIQFKHDPEKPESLGSNEITSIFEDHSGVLWIGGMNGLDKLNKERGVLCH